MNNLVIGFSSPTAVCCCRGGVVDSEANTNSPKNTLVLHSGSQSSYIALSCDSVEMAEYITNHEMNFTKTLKRDKARGEYLSSKEGKWGRQDSF